MVVSQAKLLGKVRRQPPADSEAISHRLLARAGYVDQLASGLFSFLPLGWRVMNRLIQISRKHMNAIGAQELLLPALQPASLWQESHRLTTIDPPLFRTSDRHQRELVLASTHEEVITDLARKYIDSYQDLPLAVFQIQTKFRNEMRSSGGLLRVREFLMKDLYSFHRTSDDLQAFYEQVTQAYHNIFTECDLTAHVAEADSGSIGGAVSNEFSVEAPTGEDTIAACPDGHYAKNITARVGSAINCPQCGQPLKLLTCIESGHIFQLGTTYSEQLKALFTDSDGTKKPVFMGCFGIGIGRLAATIVETHHDSRGLCWPPAVAPFQAHVLALQPTVLKHAQEVARELSSQTDVLIDDRPISAGQKFTEADLIGIPKQIIVSEKTVAAAVVEIVDRRTGDKTLEPIDKLLYTSLLS